MSATRFYCIMCGAQQTARGSHHDRLVECPACRHVVPAPAPADVAGGPAATAFPPGVLALEMKFLCDSCGHKLRIDVRWEGCSIRCPACESNTEIPRWSQRREPAPDGILSAAETAFLTTGVEIDAGDRFS